MANVTCPSCGFSNIAERRLCKNCGAELGTALVEAPIDLNLPNALSSRPLKLFNRHILDRSDPADSIGIELPGFSLYNLYSDVEYEKLGKLREDLYLRVIKRLDEKMKISNLKNVTYRLVTYADAQYKQQEAPRDYIEIVRETPRGTQATVIARFLPYGDDLYVSVSSYVLGERDNLQLLRRLLFTAPALSLLACPASLLLPSLFAATQSGQSLSIAFRQAGGAFIFSLICCLIPFFFIFSILWIDVIRGFSLHRNIGLAIRQAFNRIPREDSFNVDDVFMFFKSVLPTVLFSIREVFSENGIATKTLDEFIANVNNVTNISQTVNNYSPNQGIQGIVKDAVKSAINPLG